MDTVESAKEKSVGIDETRNKPVASKTDGRSWEQIYVSKQNACREESNILSSRVK